MVNYYTVLGVNNFAPAEDIKAAYRRLSKQWHPDLNGGSAYHAEKFKEIQAAYGCLSKPDKRDVYDYRLRNHLNGFTEQTTTQTHYQSNPYTAYYQAQPQYQRKPVTRYSRLFPVIVYVIYLVVKVSTCNTYSPVDYNSIPVTYQYNKTAQEILDSIVKASRKANDTVIINQQPNDNNKGFLK